MADEKKKKKCGRDYLKEKFAKLESEYATLKSKCEDAEQRLTKIQREYDLEVSEHQALEDKYEVVEAKYEKAEKDLRAARVSNENLQFQLQEEKNARENENRMHERIERNMYNCMGFFSRWMWSNFESKNVNE